MAAWVADIEATLEKLYYDYMRANSSEAQLYLYLRL